MEDDVMHELTAAYALDALEPERARAFEDHLGRCERCRDELAVLSGAAAALAYDAHPASPPSELRERILAAARAERHAAEPAQPRGRVPLLALAAAASCAAVVLGIWIGTHSTHPQLDSVPLRGAAGALVVSGDRSAVLVVSGLPRPPAGKTYEIWVMRAGAPARPAGLFPGGAATVRVPLERHVPRGSFVGITLERGGGAVAPSEPPLVTSDNA